MALQLSADTLQPRIDWLAFQGKHTEDAFVNAAKGLTADKPLQCLNAQGELSHGQRPLEAEAPASESRQVLFGRVVCSST